MRFAPGLAPLRHRDFALYFTGRQHAVYFSHLRAMAGLGESLRLAE